MPDSPIPPIGPSLSRSLRRAAGRDDLERDAPIGPQSRALRDVSFLRTTCPSAPPLRLRSMPCRFDLRRLATCRFRRRRPAWRRPLQRRLAPCACAPLPTLMRPDSPPPTSRHPLRTLPLSLHRSRLHPTTTTSPRHPLLSSPLLSTLHLHSSFVSVPIASYDPIPPPVRPTRCATGLTRRAVGREECRADSPVRSVHRGSVAGIPRRVAAGCGRDVAPTSVVDGRARRESGRAWLGAGRPARKPRSRRTGRGASRAAAVAPRSPRHPSTRRPWGPTAARAWARAVAWAAGGRRGAAAVKGAAGSSRRATRRGAASGAAGDRRFNAPALLARIR